MFPIIRSSFPKKKTPATTAYLLDTKAIVICGATPLLEGSPFIYSHFQAKMEIVCVFSKRRVCTQNKRTSHRNLRIVFSQAK
jgi:hypothetical protein